MPPQLLDTGSTDSNTALEILCTPVPNLFGSNVPISETDVMSIQTAISASELYLSNQHRSQSSHISAFKRFIREHRALLTSWIRRVPPEILIHIFLHCLDSNHQSPPWYLSHVCRHWRDLALSTPQLWTKIPLPTLSNRFRVAAELVAFMPEYLARSNDQTITFRWEGNWDPESLEEEDEYEDPLCGHSNTILDLLLQHAERWGSVSIISGRWSPKLEQQLAQLQNRLPRLYHLGLDIDSLQVTSTGVFYAAPGLRDIDFYIAIDRHNPQRLQHFIQWSELRRLKFVLPTFAALPHLSLCSRLVVLDLEYVGMQVATFGPGKIELPNLKYLRLCSSSDLSSDHFQLLTSPVLEDLQTYCIMAEPDPFESFRRFLERNARSLKRLTIGYIRHPFFRTNATATRLNLALLPFDKLGHLDRLQLQAPSFDKLLNFLRSISQGTIPFQLRSLHIHPGNTSRLHRRRVAELSDGLRAVVRWAETPGSGSRLRRIEITPGDVSDCWELLTALEGWDGECPSDVTASLITLRLCESKMQDVHPFPYVNTDAIIVDTFDEPRTQKVADCLDSMDFKFDQIRLLYITRLHFVLRALSRMSPDQFTPTDSDIPERALSLEEKWKPFIEDDIPHRRWMHQGIEKLVYIPFDDDLYRPYIDYWMYGLKTYRGNGDVSDYYD